MIRIAIQDADLYGQIRARAIEGNEDASLVAVADADFARAQALAQKHGARAYTDLEALLAQEEVDAVLVCSPTAHHARAALLALDAGKHVLCERPVAMTLAEADAVIEASLRKGVVLLVGHILRFWPHYLEARRILRDRSLGRPLSASAARVAGAGGQAWRARLLDPALGLGALEAHLHDLDFLAWLLGAPKALDARGQRAPQGSWGQMQTLLEFPGGVTAQAEANFLVPFNYPLTMLLRVVCEGGCLLFSFEGGLAARGESRTSLLVFRNGDEPFAPEVAPGDAYAAELEHFLRCIAEKRASEVVPLADARQALELVLTVARSAEARRPLEL